MVTMVELMACVVGAKADAMGVLQGAHQQELETAKGPMEEQGRLQEKHMKRAGGKELYLVLAGLLRGHVCECVLTWRVQMREARAQMQEGIEIRRSHRRNRHSTLQ